MARDKDKEKGSAGLAEGALHHLQAGLGARADLGAHQATVAQADQEATASQEADGDLTTNTT